MDLLHVFSLLMDCFLTVLLLWIYLNVWLQSNTCREEEVKKKKQKKIQDNAVDTLE